MEETLYFQNKTVLKCDFPGDCFTVILCHITVKKKKSVKNGTCKLNQKKKKCLKFGGLNWKFQQCRFVLCAVP